MDGDYSHWIVHEEEKNVVQMVLKSTQTSLNSLSLMINKFLSVDCIIEDMSK